MAEWVVYILRCADDTLYTGVTTQLDRRVEQHNTSPRGAKYTRCRRPVVPVYSESAEDRAAAQRREREIKKLEKAAKEALVLSFKRTKKKTPPKPKAVKKNQAKVLEQP